jgi:membrane-bound metal-dependent hydrolase YbcI (DUF457 family)
MTGASRKTIGTAAGIALFLYGWKNGNYEYAPALITAPIGAMLPDIDHGQSKLGDARGKIVKTVLGVAAVAFVAYLAYQYFVLGDVSAVVNTALWVLAPVAILVLLSNVDAIHNALHFATKHRGIMHTLVLPVLFFLGFIFLQEPLLKHAVLGLFIGYVSHILADCMTSQGCPALFPVTTKNLHFLNITTGSGLETFAMLALSAALIGVAYFVL